MLQIIHGNKASAELERILNRGISETTEIEQITKAILATVKA